MIYGVTLLGQDGEHLATEPLEADDHCQAQLAAALILDVCKDVAQGYELRFNGAAIASGRRRRGLVDLNSLLESPQANVLDLVERLEHGFSAIALSRRLRRTTARLRRCGAMGRHSGMRMFSPGHIGWKGYATSAGGIWEFPHGYGADFN